MGLQSPGYRCLPFERTNPGPRRAALRHLLLLAWAARRDVFGNLGNAAEHSSVLRFGRRAMRESAARLCSSTRDSGGLIRRTQSQRQPDLTPHDLVYITTLLNH